MNTFFGGDDSSWYPGSEQHSWFKNFALDTYSDEAVQSDINHCIETNPCDDNALCVSQYGGGVTCRKAFDSVLNADGTESCVCKYESYAMNHSTVKLSKRASCSG